ncbi:MAG: tetratricopeptide repeat protein, partial [Gammaproteobacteria bacterium]
LIEPAIDAFKSALKIADDAAGRCQVWLYLAACLRVVDRYDDALRFLALAEETAAECKLSLQLAQVHHHRGNVYFPLGNIDGCLAEHERARKLARKLASPETETNALSGLGDANYQRGHMISAHGHFERCLQLARENGFGRIEVSNRHMLGLTRYYQNDLQTALADCLAGADGAARVGQQRAEMAARSSVGPVLLDLNDFAAAQKQSELGLELAHRLGAQRFEPLCLASIARIFAREDRRADAARLLHKAFELACESGVTFAGPWILGTLALLSADPRERENALRRGEELLRGNCLAHNYFWFYRDAMEVSLISEDWDRADSYAASLENYTQAEPLPWTQFFIDRARTLASLGRGAGVQCAFERLRPLHDEARRAGFSAALPAIEDALAERSS